MTDNNMIATNLRKIEQLKNTSRFKAYKQQKAPIRLLMTHVKHH